MTVSRPLPSQDSSLHCRHGCPQAGWYIPTRQNHHDSSCDPITFHQTDIRFPFHFFRNVSTLSTGIEEDAMHRSVTEHKTGIV